MKTGPSIRRPAHALAEPRGWTGVSRGGVVGNWIFVTLLRHLGIGAAYVLLVPVALYFMCFAPAARRASRQIRLRVLGRVNPLRDLIQGYRHFFRFGQLLLDRIAINSGQRHRFHFRVNGVEHLHAAVNQRRGVLLLVAHYGNWGAAASVLHEQCDWPMSMVMFKGDGDRIQRMFMQDHAGRLPSIIAADGSLDSSLKIMAALARGEIVSMQADRQLGGEARYVPFLGAPAAFPAGPHVVAALTGVPVITMFAVWERAFHYRIDLHASEIALGRDRRRMEVAVLTGVTEYVTRLESALREDPLQWNNFYDFWAKPVAENASRTIREPRMLASSRPT